jgi:enterobactin synthetase component D
MVGSITHAGGYVSAAVAFRKDARSVGIDSEELMAKEVTLEIATLVTTQSEFAAVRAQTDYSENETLTLLFSAKEAVFKCVYPVIEQHLGFHEIEVFVSQPASSCFEARLPKAFPSHLRCGTTLYGVFEFDRSRCHTGVVLAP